MIDQLYRRVRGMSRSHQYQAPQVELCLMNGVNVITPLPCLIEKVQKARQQKEAAVPKVPVAIQLTSVRPCLPDTMMGKALFFITPWPGWGLILGTH